MRIPWGILVALLLGVGVGLAVNRGWSASTWEALGVRDPQAFLAGKSPMFVDSQGVQRPVNAPTILAHGVKLVREGATFVGQVFVSGLRVAAVPIVLFSITLGVVSLGDPRRLGRVGVRTIVLYLCTGVASVSIGLLIANVFKPGLMVTEQARQELLKGDGAAAARLESAMQNAAGASNFWQHLLAMIPTNPFDALARGDMLQVIVLAVVTGCVLATLPLSRTKPLLDACEVLNEVVGKVIALVMKLAPAAVFCLIAPVVAGLGLDVIGALGAYCLCVIGGLVVILLGVYAPLIALGGRTSPLAFYKGLSPALMVAFSSSSSNATLPVTLRCVIERLGVSPRIANFVCPIGATVNMDGTALYQGVAVIFIAQVLGVDLSLSQQLSIVVLATLAAIGSPGIPGGSLVFLVMVLQSVGVPPQGLALILGVDRLLDMCRTVVNVAGDAVASVVVGRYEAGREPPTATTLSG